MCRSEIMRVLVPNENSVPENIEKALNRARMRTVMHGTDVVILVSAYNAVPDLPIDRTAMQTLKSKYEVFDGITKFKLQRYSQVGAGLEDVVYLAIHPDVFGEKEYNFLNDIQNAQAIVMVPWTHRTGRHWIQTWNPETASDEYRTTQHQHLGAELEDALGQLPVRVASLFEKRNAKECLSEVRKRFLRLTRDQFEVWTIQRGYISNERAYLLKTWDKS